MSWWALLLCFLNIACLVANIFIMTIFPEHYVAPMICAFVNALAIWLLIRTGKRETDES